MSFEVFTQPISSGRIPFSFELYPARNAAGNLAVQETVLRLAEVSPEFISVTYGAGGSTGSRSLELLRFIQNNTVVEAMAHLTCVGSTYAEANRLIREFLDAGIRNFLALRGDPPLENQPGENADSFMGDIRTSAELVQLIDRVQTEHAPYSEAPVPGIPDAALVSSREEVTIAVAAFPNGHPQSTYPGQDIEALRAKEAAGATLAITQLFFHPDDYLAFVARAREAGVTIPILPGIMPITSPLRLRRVLELSGESLPSQLAIALEVEPTPEGRLEIGVQHAADLAEAVLRGGAPGIHLYAFNQHEAVLEVLNRAGALS